MSQEVKTLRELVAENVRRERSLRKISREKLSLLIEMDNSYISKLERARINATIDVLEKIAKVLEVDVINLFK